MSRERGKIRDNEVAGMNRVSGESPYVFILMPTMPMGVASISCHNGYVNEFFQSNFEYLDPSSASQRQKARKSLTSKLLSFAET